MDVYSYSKQVRAVVASQVIVIAVAGVLAFCFWHSLCDNTLESCLATGSWARVFTFLLLCMIRPFVLTPLFFVAVIAGKAFDPVVAALLTSLGSTVACVIVFSGSKQIGKRMTKPWLRSNLPATFKFLRSQDYKLVFATRLIPLVPFDVLSVLFGFLDFRLTSVVLATFFGSLPETYVFAKLVDPSKSLLSSSLQSVIVFGALAVLPLLLYEFFSRKRGTGMWALTTAMYKEIVTEVRTNNDIVRRQTFAADQTPVLLLYGFFSSRRAVTVLERMLISRGHPVLSFNLGGLLGTFFTRDILETATFIDYKIKRQIERHGFKKVHIVAHSKGGLVALWWALKLGGHEYCDKIVTMGTPFRGSRLTYLALATPLGLLWRDVGQMRPGSRFLRSLHDSTIPPNLDIFCLSSERDMVARGEDGVFRPSPPSSKVQKISMNRITHFEFLYRREVGDMLATCLTDGEDVVTPLVVDAPLSQNTLKISHT